jgi:AcrR family transcriptional regulator
MTASPQVPRRRAKRDAAASKRRILMAALQEFSEHGHGAARIDSIAARAQVSKPMIYSYFGDKDELYRATLREAYVQIREGERELHLEDLAPEDGVRELVRFTLEHFVSAPWFISMLNTENLLGGDAIRQIGDVGEIQSQLIEGISGVLDRGAATGAFRDGVDPVELYITIASLCYFPVSNRHTLRAVFKVPIDEAWLDQRRQMIAEMLLCYLAPGRAG